MQAELVRGDAVVTKPGVVQVGDLALAYDRLVIATGSSPFVPPLEGLAGTGYWTNIEATEASRLPVASSCSAAARWAASSHSSSGASAPPSR